MAKQTSLVANPSYFMPDGLVSTELFGAPCYFLDWLRPQNWTNGVPLDGDSVNLPCPGLMAGDAAADSTVNLIFINVPWGLHLTRLYVDPQWANVFPAPSIGFVGEVSQDDIDAYNIPMLVDYCSDNAPCLGLSGFTPTVTSSINGDYDPIKLFGGGQAGSPPSGQGAYSDNATTTSYPNIGGAADSGNINTALNTNTTIANITSKVNSTNTAVNSTSSLVTSTSSNVVTIANQAAALTRLFSGMRLGGITSSGVPGASSTVSGFYGVGNNGAYSTSTAILPATYFVGKTIEVVGGVVSTIGATAKVLSAVYNNTGGNAGICTLTVDTPIFVSGANYVRILTNEETKEFSLAVDSSGGVPINNTAAVVSAVKTALFAPGSQSLYLVLNSDGSTLVGSGLTATLSGIATSATAGAASAATAATQATNGTTAIGTVSTKLGSPAGASVSADIAAVGTAATSAGTSAAAAAASAASAATQATGANTAASSVNTKIGTPTGASVSADIASVGGAAASAASAASAGASAATTAATQATNAASTATTINTKLGSPAGASVSADIAQVPASLGNLSVGGTAGSLVLNEALLLAAASAAGSYLPSGVNTGTHQETVSYYMPGTTLDQMNSGTHTIIGSALIQYANDNVTITSRVYTFASV